MTVINGHGVVVDPPKAKFEPRPLPNVEYERACAAYLYAALNGYVDELPTLARQIGRAKMQNSKR